jgi:hypothetical protein
MGIFADLVVAGSYPIRYACLPVWEITWQCIPRIEESAPLSEIA